MEGLGYLPYQVGQPSVKIVEEEGSPVLLSLVDLDVKFARDNWWQMSPKAKLWYLSKYREKLVDLAPGDEGEI